MSELLKCLASSIPAAAESAEKLNGYAARIENRLRETEMPSTAQIEVAGVAHVDTSGVPHLSLPVDFFEAPWLGFYAQALDQP